MAGLDAACQGYAPSVLARIADLHRVGGLAFAWRLKAIKRTETLASSTIPFSGLLMDGDGANRQKSLIEFVNSLWEPEQVSVEKDNPVS